MNERIRELAKESGLSISQAYSAEFNKFAELIVRECARVAYRNVCYGNGETGPDHDIKQHFGVE